MKRVIVRLASVVAALVIATATFVVGASLERGFWTLAILALIAFIATAYVLLRWSARVSGEQSRAYVWRWVIASAVVYAVVAQLAVGSAPAHTLAAPEPPANTQYWSLPTGSRIAYQLDSAVANRGKHPPVVVLHDGPGTPALPFLRSLPSRPFDALREEGFDIYYYDQLGSGLSGRLDLARERPYTVARHVADLEAIRAAIGVSKMIVAGTGWGATLATNYVLAHPDRVERLILESPTPIWAPAWRDMINPAARAKMTDVQASALAALERPPLRLVIGRMMADFSSRAAHRFIPDWEADQWWTQRTEQSIRLGQPNLTCHTDPGQGIPAPSGLGFFANSYTLADAVTLPDPREALKNVSVQALVIRGTCDYIAWPVSAEYRKVLRASHLVAIPAAGHFIWLEQPSLWDEVVRAFVRGEKLPLEAYDPGATP